MCDAGFRDMRIEPLATAQSMMIGVKGTPSDRRT
jgi:hypothetical protein